MKKLTLNILLLLGIFALAVPSLQSCNDEPDGDNFYSFTGQMMSEYLTTNEEYSQFATIVQRAGLMDLLSAYGHYTCFAPTNDAINTYLAKAGKTMETLTDAECDTLARTHLVNVMYTVSEMGGENSTSVLPTQNMMRRNLQITHGTDAKDNAVIVINGNATVFFEHQDDSVENGIMQPVNAVIENSTSSVPSLIRANPEVSIYMQALEATKLSEKMEDYKDQSYNAEDYEEKIQYMTGGQIYEVANPPDEHLYGFTAFLVPDAKLKSLYNITDLRGLYDLACSIYDVTYPEDVNKPGHAFDHLTDSINPLYRFMAYHVLDRNVQGYNYLTVRDDVGVDKSIANTTDWYTTMLPYTMIKVEKLNVIKWSGYGDVEGDRYINRRYDDTHSIQGVHVQPSISGDYVTDGNNGVYFYIDDVLKFDEETRDQVQNCRIRMDFSTIFPEIMTNNIRMNGTYTKDDASKYDDSYKYGKNYFFPNGYLKNARFKGNTSGCYFIYRRPRANYYSMHGDEMIVHGVFDLEFEIPPVPFESDWQIRLGFAPMDESQGAARGVCQIYFDDVAQGIPLNMEERISASSVYGSSSLPEYTSTFREDEEKRAADFKILKNKGYYRGPWSIFHSADNNVNNGERFAHQPSTVRKVLCTVHIKPGQDHRLRIKNVSSLRAKDKEAMLDYLELVPKSVYGVSDSGSAEDDL